MALPKGRKGGMVVIGQRPGGPACGEGKGGEGGGEARCTDRSVSRGRGDTYSRRGAAGGDARLRGALGGMVERRARANEWAGPWLFRLAGAAGARARRLTGRHEGQREEACFTTPARRFAAGQLFARPARYFGNGACQPISRVRGRLCFKARRESFGSGGQSGSKGAGAGGAGRRVTGEGGTVEGAAALMIDDNQR